jgi:hypothetical protein
MVDLIEYVELALNGSIIFFGLKTFFSVQNTFFLSLKYFFNPHFLSPQRNFRIGEEKKRIKVDKNNKNKLFPV